MVKHMKLKTLWPFTGRVCDTLDYSGDDRDIPWMERDLNAFWSFGQQDPMVCWVGGKGSVGATCCAVACRS